MAPTNGNPQFTEKMAQMAPKNRNPQLAEKVARMRLNLEPILHIETGIPPPQFPSTLLELFLLTEDQLDAMARYYSQCTPSALTYCYPQTMDWNRPFLTKPNRDERLSENFVSLSDYERLKVKMRMFARFIGMQGAETPTWEFERQIEILKAKTDKSIEEEEEKEKRVAIAGRKFYHSPTFP